MAIISIDCINCDGTGRHLKSRFGGNDPDAWEVTCGACDGEGYESINTHKYVDGDFLELAVQVTDRCPCLPVSIISPDAETAREYIVRAVDYLSDTLRQGGLAKGEAFDAHCAIDSLNKIKAALPE